ncbi:MAG TPA: alkaline phosphatase, partial [Polyangiaceae bacterium]|nr:alkaline phosphatase [Polyangiaceae bacterium]
HEIAASRYLYGNDFGMSWREFPKQGYVTTWDVTAYNKFALLDGAAPYSESTFDPVVGYDPGLAGSQPYPLQDPATALDYYRGGTTGLAWWPATDSASAATAMSTGHKTDDGNIAWSSGDPAGGALSTIAEQLRTELGFAIGVVSTQPLSHATPASFVAHNVNRNHYYTGKYGFDPNRIGIADEIVLQTKPEVLISGGHPLKIDPTFSNNRLGYISEAAFDAAPTMPDLVFVQRATGIDGAVALDAGVARAVSENKRLFGLFGGGTGAFEFQIATDTAGAPSVKRSTIENPTLADAAVGALRVLRQDAEGFFLMVEQGDVDYANHANNYPSLIASMTDFERAVQAILAFVDEPDDAIHWDNTVVLVVADHATGYLRLGQALGIGDLPTQDPHDPRYPEGVTWATTGHSNELVTYSAKGPHLQQALRDLASPYEDTDILDNTQIYRALRLSAGLQ